MSNFYKKTFNPMTKRYERAAWIDEGENGYRVLFKHMSWSPEDIKWNEIKHEEWLKSVNYKKEPATS